MYESDSDSGARIVSPPLATTARISDVGLCIFGTTFGHQSVQTTVVSNHGDSDGAKHQRRGLS